MGVGPAGHKIIHLQPPSGGFSFPDHLIDPALKNLSMTPPTAKDTCLSSPIHWSPSPSPVKTPLQRSSKENRDPKTAKPKVKTETPLSEAILQARQNVKKIPAKRSLEDTLISLHEYIYLRLLLSSLLIRSLGIP